MTQGSGSDSGDHEADRLFLDAVLHHHFHRSDEENRKRVDGAIRRIAAESGRGEKSSPWRARWSPIRSVLVAACALVVLLLAPVVLTESASAAISRSIQAMSRVMGLHYEIEVESGTGRSIRGELWVRGDDQVVLRFDRAGRDLWLGEGRGSAWVVPAAPFAPVLVGERGQLIETLLRGDDLALPFLRVTAVLEQLRRDGFEIDYGPDREAIEARRIDRDPAEWLSAVTLRVAEDGVVRELVARSDRRGPGPRRVYLRLVDGREMPESFYEHEAHHDGRRILDRR